MDEKRRIMKNKKLHKIIGILGIIFSVLLGVVGAVDGTSYPLPMSMNDLEQALDPARFFRLNRQYIANINGIRKISFYFSSKLIVRLKGCKDENIVISKEKATLFKKWLEK